MTQQGLINSIWAIASKLPGRCRVRPHVPNAWIDCAKIWLGFEIPFNRHFYKCTPPRPLQ